MDESDSPRIVVAGGGVAGLEACIAPRSFLGAGELAIDLPAAMPASNTGRCPCSSPSTARPAWGMSLEQFAADQDIRLVRDALAAVMPRERLAVPAYSERLPYDALLVCVGARAVASVPGAITFRGGRDAASVRRPGSCRSAPRPRRATARRPSSRPRRCR